MPSEFVDGVYLEQEGELTGNFCVMHVSSKADIQRAERRAMETVN